MAGKGSAPRPCDPVKYRENHARIFGQREFTAASAAFNEINRKMMNRRLAEMDRMMYGPAQPARLPDDMPA